MSTLTFVGGGGEKRKAEAAFPKGMHILDVAAREKDFYVYAVFAVAALRDLATKVDRLYGEYDRRVAWHRGLATAILPLRVVRKILLTVLGLEEPTLGGMFDVDGGPQTRALLNLVKLVGRVDKAIEDRTFPEKCRILASSIERFEDLALRRVSDAMPNVRLHRLPENAWLLGGSFVRCIAQFAVVDPSTPVNINPKSRILFHGSPMCNWWSILTNDLVYDSRLLRHANVFGPGIYFSDDLCLSLGYTADSTGGVSKELIEAAGLRSRLGVSPPSPRRRTHDDRRESLTVVAVCELSPELGVREPAGRVFTASEGIVRAILIIKSRDGCRNARVTAGELMRVFGDIPKTRDAHPRVMDVVSTSLASGDLVRYNRERLKQTREELTREHALKRS